MPEEETQSGDQLLIVLFVFMQVIIAVGIVIGVNIFFSSSHDTRKIEADSLNNHIRRCLLDTTIDWNQNETNVKEYFYSECKLNKKVVENHYFVRVERQSTKLLAINAEQANCELGKKNIQFPQCTTSTLTLNDQQFTIVTGAQQKPEKKTI